MCEACSPDTVLLARSGLGGLVPSEGTRSPGAGPVPASGAVLVRGGPIITMADGRFSPVEALAIRDGTVRFAGAESEARTVAGPDAEELDLHGRCAMPGFVEPHVHLVVSAYVRDFLVDVSPPAVQGDRDKAIAILQAEAAKHADEPGTWIQAFGYDPSRMKDYADLDATALNRVSTTHPVFVLNQSGHLAYVNDAAFAVAKITADTPDPAGGTFVKVDGKLTGVILEQPAIVMVSGSAPRPSSDAMVDACRATLADWSTTGCTTVYDAGVGSILQKEDIALVSAATGGDDCPIRMVAAVMPEVATAAELTPGAAMGGARAVGIKFWADGSTQGFTAALRKPYLGQKTVENHLNWDTSVLISRMRPWHEQGWQLLVHSNGDAASDQTMDAYEAVLSSGPGPHHHRIEHFTVTEREQVARAASLGLGVSHTIGHVRYWGSTLEHHVLGPERALRVDPLADDRDLGARFSLHSDSPVTKVGPLGYLRTAVTRLMDLPEGDEERVLGPEQRIDLEEALCAVTLTPARHAMLDEEVGSLEPGKSADLVILATDPREVEPREIDRIQVEETWLAGRRRVWTAVR